MLSLKNQRKNSKRIQQARSLAITYQARLDPDHIMGINDVIHILENSLDQAKRIKASRKPLS